MPIKFPAAVAPRPRIDQADGPAAPGRPSASQPSSRFAAAGPSELGPALPMHASAYEAHHWAAQPRARLKVPDRHHFVWVGQQLPQRDLLTAQHLAARGGQVTLWTDRPARAMATATSLHSPKAGSLDTSISLSIGDHGRAGRCGLRLMHVDQAFNTAAASPVEAQLTRRLDALQAIEGAGGGNPAARSDVVRYQVLHQEGGVYTDFDRAESIRPRLKSNPLQRTYPPLQGDVLVPLHGISYVRLKTNNVSGLEFNSDLLASVRGSAGIAEVRQQVVLGYANLSLTRAWQSRDPLVAQLGRLKTQLQHESQAFFDHVERRMVASGLQRGFEKVDQAQKEGRPLPFAMRDKDVLTQSRNPRHRGNLLHLLKEEAVMLAAGPRAVGRANTALGLKDAIFMPNDPANLRTLQQRYSATDGAMAHNPARGSWRTDEPDPSDAPPVHRPHEAP